MSDATADWAVPLMLGIGVLVYFIFMIALAMDASKDPLEERKKKMDENDS